MLCHAKITAHDDSSSWAVLIHGLFGSADNLNLLAKTLSSNINVIQIDLPDHGKSPHTTEFNFNTYCDMIIDTLHHYQIKTAHFVGHSLGGKMSMHIALTYPEIVTSLVIADIAPVSYRHRHQTVLHALASVDLTTITNRNEVKHHLDNLLNDEGTSQFLLKSLYKNEHNHWAWRFNHSLLARDYDKLIQWPKLSEQYSGPTLFIKGQASDYIIADYQPIILALFPHATSKIMNGTGHWLHAQKPVVFNRIVENFIAALIQ